MTEAKVFEFLLQNQYDFPKLHSEAASTVANSLTDIIYDTLKLKSSLPTGKRLNVLKFLKTLGAQSETHVSVNEKNYEVFVESLQLHYEGDQDFIKLEHGDLCSEVQEFYRRKNEKNQKKVKRLELIKKYDQEALDKAEFSGRISRNISYYETSENIIKQLLFSNSQKIKKSVDVADLNYRKKQIKFAYALIHLSEWGTLKKVLRRLHKYKNLTNCEVNFLIYLNENVSDLRPFLVENFIFVYEKSVIDLCTKIIQLDQAQILDFFEALLFDEKFLIIKQLCEDEFFKSKLKHILFELYSYSFCNSNILKFVDFLI